METKFAVLKMCWMLGLADAGGTVGLLSCFFEDIHNPSTAKISRN